MPASQPAETGQMRVREQDLAGKVAVVTGASKGIGRAIAINLATRGCSVLATCSSRETLHLIDALVHEIGQHYESHHSKFLTPKIIGISANILAPECADKTADAVDKHFKGHLDIFVNNAGITGSSKLGEMDDNHVQKFTIGNIQTPALIVDEFVKRQQFHKNSRIVLISSVRSKKSTGTSLMYSASKAAGEALVRTWAAAFGGKDAELAFMAGTTANSVLVGLTRTTTMDRHSEEDVQKKSDEFLPSMALPKIAEAEDVADVVGLLCSQDARFITGSVVSADGGGINIC